MQSLKIVWLLLSISNISFTMHRTLSRASKLSSQATSHSILTRSLSVCASQKYAAPGTSIKPAIKMKDLRHMQQRSIVSVPVAIACTVVGGGIGGAAGFAMDGVFDTEGIFTILGALIGLGIGSCAFLDTESSNAEYVEYKMNSVDKKLLALIEKQGDELINDINSYYVAHSTPLATAFNDLSSSHESLRQAKKLADLLFSKTHKEKYREMSNKCDEPMKHIQNALITIKSQPKFVEQMNALHMRRTAEAAEVNAVANSVNAAANVVKALSSDSSNKK